MIVQTVEAHLIADASKFRAGVSEAEASAKSFSSNGLSKVNEGIKETGGRLDGMKESFGRMKEFAGGLLMGEAFMSVGGAIKSAFDGAMEASDNMAHLEAVLKSTHGAAGITKDAAVDLANSFRDVTKFDDDAVLSGENLLLTFTNIGQGVFPDATEAMLNMSEALGQDLKGSAIQLGKALNDPTNGMTALRRVGVSFTEQQVNLVKSLQASGNMSAAQGVILSELSTEFGGAAKAAGETFPGKLVILKNHLGDIGKSIALGLMDPMTNIIAQAIPFAKAFAEKIPDALKWLGEKITAFRELAQPVLDKIGFTVGKIVDVFKALATGDANSFFTAITEGISKLTGVDPSKFHDALQAITSFLFGTVPQAVGAAKTALESLFAKFEPTLHAIGDYMQGHIKEILIGLGIVIGALISPISLIIVGVAALREAWISNWGDIQGKVQAVWSVIEPIWRDIMHGFDEFIAKVLPEWTRFWANITGITAGPEGAGGLLTSISTIITAIQTFWQDHFEQISRIFGVVFAPMRFEMEAFFNFVTGMIRIFLALLSGDWGGAWEALKDMTVGYFSTLQRYFGTYLSAIRDVAGFLAGKIVEFIVSAFMSLWTPLTLWLGGISDKIGFTFQSIRDNVSAKWGEIVQVFVSALTTIQTWIGSKWQGFLDTITNFLNMIHGAITAIWNVIPLDIQQDLILIGTTLIQRFGQFLTDTQTWLSNTWNSITNKWNEILAWIGNVFSAIGTTVSNGWNAISTTTGNVLSAIGTTVNNAWNAVSNTVGYWLSVLGGAVSSAWNGISTTIGNIMSGIGTAVNNGWNALITQTGNAWNAVVLAIQTPLNTVSGFVGGIMSAVEDTIRGWINSITGQSTAVGTGIMDGIKNGINGGWKMLTDLVGNLARSLLQAAKDALGIKSPSSMFAMVGDNILAGLSGSLQSGFPAVIRMGANYAAQIPEAATAGVSTNYGPSSIVNHWNFKDTSLDESQLLRAQKRQEMRHARGL